MSTIDKQLLFSETIVTVSNGIKFTDTGSVTFKVETLRTGSEEDRGVEGAIATLRFSIKDTGVGITDEQLEKIFLPFEQVGSKFRRADGTGLGLAICEKILDIMGSSIQVSSIPGKGSTFWFDVELPVKSQWMSESAVADAGKIIGYEGRRRKILVVDDKEVNRAVVVEVLSSLGFECAEANNGEEGLTVAQQFQPDLIITDLVMPVLDGFEMTRRLRQNEQFNDAIVIASSASVMGVNQAESVVRPGLWSLQALAQDAERQSLEAGCNDFLAKPIEIEKLLIRLQKYLELEWIYESGQLTATSGEMLEEGNSSEFIPPPEEVLLKIYNAARIGDIEAIEYEAEKIKQLDIRYARFANRVLQLAAEFEDKEIQDLADLCLSK